MNDNDKVLEYIQKIFDVKFEGLNTRLDSIEQTLSINHTELKGKVDDHEKRLTTIESKNEKNDKDIFINEFKKEVIHWSIPALFGLILIGIKSKLGS
jgi:GTP-dependent phosphoenolpyruvate carboxykinase